MSSETTADDIVQLGAAELARQIAAGKMSATEVVEAHINRIEQVDPKLNAVVVRCFARARRDAAFADKAQAHGDVLDPLHGVPVTIKECFYVGGTDATVGVDRLCGRASAHDSPLVMELRDAGAIVLGKTNVPQLMLMHETDNPVYGRTNNPWNLDRSPGGSSGGEAAIIAAYGSPLGLGTDLGGSIRQPAHSCGIAGFKPTSGRPPLSGCVENFPGLLAMEVQPGLLARRVEDLALAMRVLTVPEQAYPNFGPGPHYAWDDPAEIDVGRLRVGVWEDDGWFTPSPAIRRAVREAAAVLQSEGAEIEPFAPPEIPLMMQLYSSVLTSDGGASLRRLMGAGRRDWRVRQMLLISRLPRWLRPPTSAMLRGLGQVRMARTIDFTGPRSADAYRTLGGELIRYAERFHKYVFDRRLDVLLFPVHGLPAITHGGAPFSLSPASYSFLANALGAPAGSLPVTRVRAGEECDRPDSVDRIDRGAKQIEQHSAGLPIGVQVMAGPWGDEMVLAVMDALETHFAEQPDYPRLALSP